VEPSHRWKITPTSRLCADTGRSPTFCCGDTHNELTRVGLGTVTFRRGSTSARAMRANWASVRRGLVLV
jgi:hypothetical protein